jgi:hypothetical protein
LAMGFHPSKARLDGQFLLVQPSDPRGPLHRALDVGANFTKNGLFLASVTTPFADVAIQFAGKIDPRTFRGDAAPGSRVGPTELNQFLARRAGVTVVLGIESEVGAGNVPSVRLDLSKTAMRGVMSFSLTNHARLSAEP